MTYLRSVILRYHQFIILLYIQIAMGRLHPYELGRVLLVF